MGQLEGEGREVESVTGNNVRYLCPQRLREEKGAKANLFFRVLAPELDVRIEARCQDRVIASKKERRVGEMCSIQIPLDDVTDDVIINVVKEA